jgi:hypothetical protein
MHFLLFSPQTQEAGEEGEGGKCLSPKDAQLCMKPNLKKKVPRYPTDTSRSTSRGGGYIGGKRKEDCVRCGF